MGIDTASDRMGARRVAIGMVVLFAVAATGRAAGPEETIQLDCGVNALYILLDIEGRHATIDRLQTVLPPRHPAGYSMAELASAAKSLGLDLEGVRFSKGDRALTRPAIAFLDDAKGGHFTVLRPVGSTGTMVQVIDPPNFPWIADYDRVLSAKRWTGLILIPRDPWSRRLATPLLVASACAAILAVAFRLRRRSSARLAPTPA